MNHVERQLPQVSVVIATYNGEKWIERTIASVLEQTHQDFELIIVDDGSTDGTASKIRALMGQLNDPRIQYVYQPNSGTAACPRNHGLRLARAPYVTFLDHDDLWYPQRLGHSMKVLREHPEVAAVCHDEHNVLEGQRLSTNTYGPQTDSMYRDMLLTGNRLSTSATTLRTELVRELGGFDERSEFFTVEDFDLWLKLAQKGLQVHFLHEVLGEYTLHSANISGDSANNYLRYMNLYRAHLDANAFELAPYRSKILGRLEYSFARNFQKAGDFKRAQRHYQGALANHFYSPKLVLGWMLNLIRVKA